MIPRPYVLFAEVGKLATEQKQKMIGEIPKSRKPRGFGIFMVAHTGVEQKDIFEKSSDIQEIYTKYRKIVEGKKIMDVKRK